MVPDIFRGFWVPAFEVLDIWWVVTPKTYTFGKYTFQGYFGFAVQCKTFPAIFGSCSVHVTSSGFFTTAESDIHTLMGSPPRLWRCVVYNWSYDTFYV